MIHHGFTSFPSKARCYKHLLAPVLKATLEVLRSSLGGDGHTLLLVTVHPSQRFVEQSLTSLRFAQKARSVENYVKVRDASGIIQAKGMKTVEMVLIEILS